MRSRSDLSKQIPLSGLSTTELVMERQSSITGEERGAIYTRREVVEFILDLSGYTEDKALYNARLLEPSYGNGDFLLVAIERLLRSFKTSQSQHGNIVDTLAPAIRAVEIYRPNVSNTRVRLAEILCDFGAEADEINALLSCWIIEGDFLLVDLPHKFTHVVGNPPYVRQELIPDPLIAIYRERYATIYDRADLYVPFIEKSLTSLDSGGVLGFICADRWMKNRYGGPLRHFILKNYHIMYYIDMVDTPAFHSDVTAYPAIIIISRDAPGKTRLVYRPEMDSERLLRLANAMKANTIPPESEIIEVSKISNGDDPWILHSFDQVAVVRRLESEFPTLEEARCKVGIGVATGADEIFIRPYELLDVEEDRKLPLATTKDLVGNTVKWRGLGIINPFHEDGRLVDLKTYPRLARYLGQHRERILSRYVAKKNPHKWYRTIDRIYPELTYRPKLLIPDIKGDAQIVYEEGNLYPHHNLYYITSEEWDLRALQTILKSGIAMLFVSIYSVKMRGGYLRFQAQYLRRIRLPYWSEVPEGIKLALIEAAGTGNAMVGNWATFDLYRLTNEERSTITGNGNQV